MNTSTTFPGGNAIGNAADRAHQAVDHAADKAAPVFERATNAAHQTIDKAAEAAKPAAEWVSENTKELAAQSTQLADACSAYVRSRPFVTLAGALAVGYFVGKLLR